MIMHRSLLFIYLTFPLYDHFQSPVKNSIEFLTPKFHYERCEKVIAGLIRTAPSHWS